MQHIATREWHMACNWKIFCDNVLVSGRMVTACAVSPGDPHSFCSQARRALHSQWLPSTSTLDVTSTLQRCVSSLTA